MIMNTKLVIEVAILLSIFFVSCVPFMGFCLETDTITSGLSVKLDTDTIISQGHAFKLGLFAEADPNSSTNRYYLGIFYNVSEKVVIWVANRDKPLKDSKSSSTLTVSQDHCNLVLVDGENQMVWSTSAAIISTTCSVQLEDTGNLVLRDDATGTTIWESFSHPSNVYVPTMRLSHNINTGKKVVLSSWKYESDPGVGNFTSGIEALNIPQSFIWNVDGRPHWRSGPWNGQIFIGIKYLHVFSIPDCCKWMHDEAGTFYFSMPELRFFWKLTLNSSGSLVQTMWNDQKKNWDVVLNSPETECDVYGTCGPFGSCNAQDSPICSCLRGFEPTNKGEWNRGNWTNGCQRRKHQLQCDQRNNSGVGENGDRFFRVQFMKVPDFAQQFSARNKDECRSRCLRNCSCLAYAYEPNIGCMFWSHSLIDVQKFAGIGVDLYLRVSASELDTQKDKRLLIIIPVSVGLILISIIIFIVRCWIVKRKGDITRGNRSFEAGPTFSSSDANSIILKDELEIVNIEELPLFTFKTLANATDQFGENKLLGEGGFGPVYKGILANGKEIAVKRNSAASGQGMKEFMNEVIVISKLQHRNLVRLLGCCVEKEEKMLIYEYMPNKSLDVCLFDPTHPSQTVLDWTKRFSIIKGIGRGLLYLHRDSRLRIIHRDLKPSNILLDEDCNPKISDFGLARIFGGNQEHGNTARVIGTYGYMAPEYATEGRFSEKSDIYSFGVLMLEIVKGKKNTHYYNHDWSLSLLGSAWKLWSEDNGLAFADEAISSPDQFKEEIVRCIHIALLCVQQFPKDRPAIQTVLSMLSCEIVDLPLPEQPVFAEKWNAGLTLRTGQDGHSINGLTLTVLRGR